MYSFHFLNHSSVAYKSANHFCNSFFLSLIFFLPSCNYFPIFLLLLMYFRTYPFSLNQSCTSIFLFLAIYIFFIHYSLLSLTLSLLLHLFSFFISHLFCYISSLFFSFSPSSFGSLFLIPSPFTLGSPCFPFSLSPFAPSSRRRN